MKSLNKHPHVRILRTSGLRVHQAESWPIMHRTYKNQFGLINKPCFWYKRKRIPE